MFTNEDLHKEIKKELDQAGIIPDEQADFVNDLNYLANTIIDSYLNNDSHNKKNRCS